MRILSAALAGMFLTSCGGGNAISTAPCVALAIVRIQLFGDSTQLGFDSASPGAVAPHNPRAELQTFFNTLYPGRVVVISRAVNGTSARKLVHGEDGMNKAWPLDVAADIVVMNHGINDLYPVDDINEYRKNLRVLSTAPDARVIFETPNVLRLLDIEPYAKVMREVAAEKGLSVADTYAYTNSLSNWRTLLYDNAHPSDELYQMISRDVVQPTLAPIVAQMLCK